MAGEQQGQSPVASRTNRFHVTPARRRRRAMALAALRSIVFVALIVTAYFVLPFTRPRVGPIATVVAGLIVLAIALTLQIRTTMRSQYPGLRALEALASSGPLFLVLFASTHYLIAHNYVHSYSQTMTRLDALYFTLTVFTTVGFGDITPVSELARIVTVLQMVGDLLLIFVVARVLFSAVKVGIERRDRPPSAALPEGADASGPRPERHHAPDV